MTILNTMDFEGDEMLIFKMKKRAKGLSGKENKRMRKKVNKYSFLFNFQKLHRTPRLHGGPHD